MKSFIYKIIFFIIIYLAISFFVSFFTPYHWGNPWFSSKIQFLEKEKKGEYNTFFFGSSRVYRQINPKIFDSTFNSVSNEKIKSFNLGAPGTFNPETFYLLESFLNSNLSEGAKYCFVELTEIDLLGGHFMHQEKTSYWQNPSNLIFAGESIYYNEQLSFKRKLEAVSNYSISYLEKIFRLGHFGNQIIHSDYYDSKYLGANRDGYFSLELDFETTNDRIVKKHLYDRKQSILEKPEVIETIKINIGDYYNNNTEDYDKVNLRRILELIQKSHQKGIRLIFIISPRNGKEQLLNLCREIPEDNIIDMRNPETYPELYEYENSFDVGHLNTKGSILYSKMLAKQFIK